MAFLDSLENLQNAPKKKRLGILIILVTLFMALVIGLWVLQLKGEPSREAGPSFIEPIKLIWNSLKENMAGIGSLNPFYEKR